MFSLMATVKMVVMGIIIISAYNLYLIIFINPHLKIEEHEKTIIQMEQNVSDTITRNKSLSSTIEVKEFEANLSIDRPTIKRKERYEINDSIGKHNISI